jgi:hypothetical protein
MPSLYHDLSSLSNSFTGILIKLVLKLTESCVGTHASEGELSMNRCTPSPVVGSPRVRLSLPEPIDPIYLYPPDGTSAFCLSLQFGRG